MTTQQHRRQLGPSSSLQGVLWEGSPGHHSTLFLLWLSPVSHTCGHHRTILPMSPSTFMWGSGNKRRSSGCAASTLTWWAILIAPSPIYPFHRPCVLQHHGQLPSDLVGPKAQMRAGLGKSSWRRQTPETFSNLPTLRWVTSQLENVLNDNDHENAKAQFALKSLFSWI